MMCETLGVKPGACIYLDDLGVNLKPARAMGMATIKVESGPQAIAALEQLTSMNLH
jgi:putative hydrolase of the HAD superfamily